MEQELLNKLCEISKETVNFTGEAKFRDSIQDIFNSISRSNTEFFNKDCALNETFFAAQSLLKQFYNYHYANADVKNQAVNITALIKAVAFCTDILASEWNRRVFFLGDSNDVFACCCERQLIWTLMSLTANAVMYSDEKYIGISLKANDDFIYFSIENCGTFNSTKYFSAFTNEKSSLYCIKRIAEKHGGTLLCSYEKKDDRKSIIKLCMSIKNIHLNDFKNNHSCVNSELTPCTDKTETRFKADARFKAETPSVMSASEQLAQRTGGVKNFNNYITDFLDDRMSPLYTAFCEFLF